MEISTASLSSISAGFGDLPLPSALIVNSAAREVVSQNIWRTSGCEWILWSKKLNKGCQAKVTWTFRQFMMFWKGLCTATQLTRSEWVTLKRSWVYWRREKKSALASWLLKPESQLQKWLGSRMKPSSPLEKKREHLLLFFWNNSLCVFLFD